MKITVVTIAYNAASTIRRTVESVISQDYSDVEYIVVDGASTDGTLAILQEYSSHITQLVSEPDCGISDAFNKGLHLATGDLVVFINSDDFLLPGALNTVSQAYRDNHEILATNLWLENPDTGARYLLQPSTTFPVPPFFRKSAHQGMYVPLSVYRRIGGYDTAIRCPMDLDFMMRAYRAGIPFRHVDVATAVFQLGGLTAKSMWGKRKDYIRLIRRNGGNFFQAYGFWLFLVACDWGKRLGHLLMPDWLYRLRYRH